MFLDNFEWFDFVYTDKVNGKNFIFSHAGFLVEWLMGNIEELGFVFGNYDDDEIYTKEYDELKYSIDFDFIDKFNWKSLWIERVFWKNCYAEASYSRGGNASHGSIVWADVHEHLLADDVVKDCIQVFGHSQQAEDPIRFGDNIYCLDCRRVFAVTNDGEVVDENMETLPENGTAEAEEYKERLKKYSAFFF